MVWVPIPTSKGVYVVMQVDTPPEPESVQLKGLNVPVPAVDHFTPSTGKTLSVGAVSMTVAVQVVG